MPFRPRDEEDEPQSKKRGDSVGKEGARKSTDPLDDPNFNPLDYINQTFPNDQSLGDVDTVLIQLKRRIRKLDNEIRDVVRSQTNAGEEGKRELEEAKRAINELFSKVDHIREKAEQSEEMVQEITKDIKSLDYAKRHLTTSITTLRKLNMLVSASEQLKVMEQKKQYRDAAHLLQAVQQLVLYFHEYRNIKKIQELSDAVEDIKRNLKRRSLEDFNMSFGLLGELEAGRSQILVEACELATALENDTKKRIEEIYCDAVLRDYKTNFHFSSEAGSLDKANLRFNWFRRMIPVREKDVKEVFPEDWRMLEAVAVAFCYETSLHFTHLLSKAKQTDSMDVKVVLGTLQKTIDFEGYLARQFEIPRPEEKMEGDHTEEVPEQEQVEEPADTAEAIKLKYKKYMAEKKRQEKMSEKTVEKKPARVPMVPNPRFYGLISKSFEPHLSLYINAEEDNLKDLFPKLSGSVRLDDSISVLSSSSDLFYFYKQSFQRCAKLSTGNSLFELSQLFGKYLLEYAKLLHSKIPQEADIKKGFTDEDIKLVCLVLNTSDYCYSTTEQLESKMMEKIDSILRDKINFGVPKEAFLGVLKESMTCLVNGVLASCSGAFTAMLNLRWNAIESVGDQSRYVTEISQSLSSKVQIIRQTISASKYFKNFCNKIVEAFAARHVSNIFKCKTISEVGAEQLLLDTQALRSILISMIAQGEQSGAAPATYVKLVTKEMAKPEAIAKVILTPLEPAEGLVENYIFLFGNTDLANFQAILDLRGVKKADQQALIDVFRSHLPSTPSGESSVTGNLAAPSFQALNPTKVQNVLVKQVMNINTFIKKGPTGPAPNPPGNNPGGNPPSAPPPPPRPGMNFLPKIN